MKEKEKQNLPTVDEVMGQYREKGVPTENLSIFTDRFDGTTYVQREIPDGVNILTQVRTQ